MSPPFRRSSRLKTKEPVAFAGFDSPDDNEDGYLTSEEPSEDDTLRTRKRRKPSTKRGEQTHQKRRGKLARLPNMPIDILCEIFGHLRPMDLLYLAWTTKALRGVLMSRSSRFVWKQVLAASDGLPACPPDLTEPQYARLAFHQYCHFCQASSITNVMWTVRARACKKCVNEQFTFTHGVGALIPTELRDAFRTAGYCSLSQLSNFVNQIFASGMRRYDYYSPRFLTAHVQKFSDDALRLINDGEKFQAFLQEKKQSTAAIHEHALKCESWYQAQRDQRRGELQDVRGIRRASILQKLMELGWESELEHLRKNNPYAFNNHALVKQPRELTDRIWTNIKPKLEKWLEAKREERLERERVQRVVTRLGALKEVFNDYYIRHIGEIIPTIADVFVMPEFNELLNSGEEVIVTAETLAPILVNLPEMVKSWRVENLEKLVGLVSTTEPPSQKRKGKEKEDYSSMLPVLNLATCLFRCPYCVDALSCERLFYHRCLISPGVQMGYDFNDPEKAIYLNLGYVPRHYKRPFGGLEYSEDLSECAAFFVQMSGLDPKVATGKEMDAAGFRFACHHCSSRAGDKKVMGWRYAVSHQIIHHNKSLFRWSKLDANEEARARSLEESFKPTIDLLRLWRCSKCANKTNRYLSPSFNRPEVIEHNVTVHEIQDAKEGKHYFKEPDRLEPYGGNPVTLNVENLLNVD